MFHIALLGYIYVVVMFSLAQDSWARGLVCFFIFAFFPILVMLWARGQKSRNRRAAISTIDHMPDEAQKSRKQQE